MKQIKRSTGSIHWSACAGAGVLLTGGIIDSQPFKYVSFVGGYRAIYQDYEEGSKGSKNYRNFDATMHGPLIGVNFRW